jgi:dTDP-glucose 4,6-dehydratase
VTGVALVTGGAGFIGSHLCERLLADGYGVVCLDNFSTAPRSNVEHLVGLPGFSLVEHDITQPYERAHEPSLVFHLASPASPRAYLRLPVETLDVASRGTRNALQIAHQSGATFILASTSEIYGDPDVSPQPETYRGRVALGPRGVYDTAKRFAEALVTATQAAQGVQTRIARIFNTYGPRLQPDDGRAMSNFITQALTGAPLTVYGDGTHTRSFCYVTDLVEGLVALAQSDVSDPINLGNPDERSVLEIASLVKTRTGSESPITFHALPDGDPAQRRPDIGRARAALGWEPVVSLEDGLDQTIEWFRRRLLPG